MREALASAKPTLGREAAEGRAESPVVPVWGMVAGLGAAVSGSGEWARGRRATDGPRQMSTHQRAYARDESEKLSDAGARSGVKGCHSANGTLSGQATRGRRRTSGLTLGCRASWRRRRGAARGEAALGGPRHMRGVGAVPGRGCTA
jgi:hypothetical protein